MGCTEIRRRVPDAAFPGDSVSVRSMTRVKVTARARARMRVRASVGVRVRVTIRSGIRVRARIELTCGLCLGSGSTFRDQRRPVGL